ncbi:hypothetical protein F4821DRAFT_263592 [Hypoxylon rubiginosum]|uniref:Uncharacterized protein n=1 Tax=Hypoxylon rubiginosum TaxID=110542 RepID=A0ACC0CQZ1_9PEZI|nr:hypothetical protein F4821DRAFT_263592 [Hypoxylon rubiginosum]
MKAFPLSAGPNGSRVSKKRSVPRLGDGLCEILVSTLDSPVSSNNLSGLHVGFYTGSPGSPSSIQTYTVESPALTTSPVTEPTCYLDDNQEIRHPDSGKSSIQPQLIATPVRQEYARTTGQHGSNPSLGFGLSETADSSPPSQDEDSSISHHATTPETCTSSTCISPTDTLATSLSPGSVGAGHLPLSRNDMTKANDATPRQPLSLKAALQSVERTISHNSSPTKRMRYAFLSKLSKYDGLGNRVNIHVFVDMSNIHVSFCDAYKTSQGIPTNRRTLAPSFHFKVFASILERGRPVEKKILAGSTSSGCGEDHRTYWPRHFFEAEDIGYQMNIFGRVQKRKPFVAKAKRKGKNSPRSPYPFDMNATSGDDMSEDCLAVGYEIRNGEQGVDENLHLNMMNSLFERQSNPGTIVLATGDAARAEFSSGFLAYATRLLDAGWNVELVAWKKTLSSSWTNSDFTEKYLGRFHIIFLDEFLEDLQTNFLD